MQAYVEEGTLTVIPDTYEDVEDLKWFLKEFSVHGNKMINIVNDVNESKAKEQGQSYKQYPAYQGYDKGYKGWYENEPRYGRHEDDREENYPRDRQYVDRYPTNSDYRGRGNPRSRS